MANPLVVFVQGAKPKEQKFPWMFFHFHPKLDQRPSPVDLVFFDFLNGEVKTWKSWTAPRADEILTVPAPDDVQTLAPQVQPRKQDGSLDTGPARSSVVGVYDFIKAQPAGSIVSFQVFSHGWRGGPILWDTWEFDDATGLELDEDDLTVARDPNDTDFRKRDFFGSNPAADAAFKDAFAADAFIKLWGCNFEQDKRSMVRKFWKVPKRRSAYNNGRRDGYLSSYLDAIDLTFPMTMARALGRKVWASPVGWGSTPWEHDENYKGTFPPKLSRENWWRVSPLFRGQDKGVKFYEDILGAEVDKVDYVAFDDAWTQAVRAALVAAEDRDPPGAPRELQQRLADRIAALQPRLGGDGEDGEDDA